MSSEVKVSVNKHSGKKIKVRRMVIEPAGNGAISTVEHEPSGDEKGGMGWVPGKETKTVHPTMGHLKKHVQATMGGSFPTAAAPGPAKGANDEEAAEDEDE